MIPAAFDYAVPADLDEAVALLVQHGDEAKLLAGGHSLIPLLKLRLARPGVVIDLRRIGGLRALRATDEGLVIGAAVTHGRIADAPEVAAACPLLARVAEQIGDVQVRNVGTIGGSLVHADPAADWPAALIAAGARAVLFGPGGERTLDAEELCTGMLESAARPDELLVRVLVPAAPRGAGAAYRKLKQQASGFALAGAAVQLTLDGDRIARARIGVTGVGDRAYRPAEVEARLAGAPLDEDALRQACEPVADGVEVLSDMHAGEDYRRQLARVLTRRAVQAAAAEAAGS